MDALKKKEIVVITQEQLSKSERQKVLAKALNSAFELTGATAQDFTWFSNKEVQRIGE